MNFDFVFMIDDLFVFQLMSAGHVFGAGGPVVFFLCRGVGQAAEAP